MTSSYEFLQDSRKILSGKGTLKVFDYAAGEFSEDVTTYS